MYKHTYCLYTLPIKIGPFSYFNITNTPSTKQIKNSYSFTNTLIL